MRDYCECFEEVELTQFARKILAEIAKLSHASARNLELDSVGKVLARVSTLRRLISDRTHMEPENIHTCLGIRRAQ
jgi:hypothetical protein